MQSYALAVSAAMSVAVAARKLLEARPGLARLGPFVPYLAVITAGTCNVGFTRMDEIRNGIDVSDEHGNKLGRSVAAGAQPNPSPNPSPSPYPNPNPKQVVRRSSRR